MKLIFISVHDKLQMFL